MDCLWSLRVRRRNYIKTLDISEPTEFGNCSQTAEAETKAMSGKKALARPSLSVN